MTRLHFLLAAAFLQFGLCTTAQAQDDSLIIGNREFFVGEEYSTRYGHFPQDSFVFSRLRWLRNFIANDTLVAGYDIKVRETQGMTALEKVSIDRRNETMASRVLDDPRYNLPGYITYTQDDPVPGHLTFYPTAENPHYMASCTLEWPAERVTVCRVSVAYPNDTNVAISTLSFLPGPIQEYGPKFADIAARVVEIGTCLDITDRAPDYPENLLQAIEEGSTNLSNC